jgi:hypothetical protein
VTDTAPDIRLIAADMDGTLLDDEHELHDHLWPLIDALSARGITFCAASGRQYHNLVARFPGLARRMTFIAENGAYVVHGGKELSSDTLDDRLVGRVIAHLRDLVRGGADLGVVVCGKDSAYIERVDAPFREQVDKYYARLTVLADLLSRPADAVLKIAVYDFGSAESGAGPALATFATEAKIVVSGAHWVDVMNTATNKGAALRSVQSALGITADQTMAFGDYLNDLELLDAAMHSYAMANAHPAVRQRARAIAPSNTDNGVVRTISEVLGLDWH